jgi:hypothetical protein
MGLTKPRAAQIFNLDYKQSTRVVTTTNITLSGGAPNSVDGVTLSLNDRVLVTGQSTASQNGLYLVTTLGSGSNGTWARTSDGNENGEIEAGMIVMVTEGTIYADTQWKLITDDPIVINTTALTFTQNYMANSISSGTSNVVVNSNANVTVSSAGTANVLTVSNTGAFVSGVVSATGNVTGNYILGNGALLTGVITSSSNINNGTSNVTVVSSGGNVTVGIGGTGNVATFTTAGLVANSVAATNNGAGTNFKVGDDTWLGDINVADTLSIRGQQNAANAYIVFGNADGTQLGRAGSGPLTYGGAFSAAGNVTGGNILTVGRVSGTGNITGGNLLTGGLISATSTITSTANVIGGNVSTVGVVTATGNVAGGNILTGGLITATGNVTAGNVLTSGLISATGNISGGNILGNGAGLSGINAFSNITVTGGNSAVADSIADTLTLTAGDGITIVVDSATDTVTIAASGSSEIFVDGADFGTVTEPVTLSDDLGLVTEAVTEEADLGSLVTSGLIYPDQFVLPSYTANALPSASVAGAMIYVTNETGGAVPAFADGTNWRRVTDRAIVT